MISRQPVHDMSTGVPTLFLSDSLFPGWVTACGVYIKAVEAMTKYIWAQATTIYYCSPIPHPSFGLLFSQGMENKSQSKFTASSLFLCSSPLQRGVAGLKWATMFSILHWKQFIPINKKQTVQRYCNAPRHWGNTRSWVCAPRPPLSCWLHTCLQSWLTETAGGSRHEDPH